MPNKKLSLLVAIFISAVSTVSSFAVFLPAEETKPQVSARPKQKKQAEVQVAEEKPQVKREKVQEAPQEAREVSREQKAVTPAPEPERPYRRANLTWQEIKLLAHMVQGEARGEPFIGKVAVASVVLNRLEAANFPDTVAEIIYGKGEFCTVRDGQINLPPDGEAYRAVELALGGWDPSYGALYFYNPARSTSKWIFSRPVTVKYGQHIFAG